MKQRKEIKEVPLKKFLGIYLLHYLLRKPKSEEDKLKDEFLKTIDLFEEWFGNVKTELDIEQSGIDLTVLMMISFLKS